MDCPSTYTLIKDFAGPVAAIIASSVAGGIAYTFGKAQKQIASSQRDIAFDKLKFDLFRNRYEVYEAAKALIEHVSLVSDIQKCDPTKVRSLYIKLDEARFYFPPNICAFLDDLHARCELFFSHLSMREQFDLDDSEQWSKTADLLAADQSALRAIYAALPQRFETAFAFKQLTSPRAGTPHSQTDR
jgi:hypothetical protein